MMIDKLSYKMVNLITFYRLAAAPVLLVLLIERQLDIFKWLLALSFFTDAIDGWLARKFRVVSILGARVDSIADDLTVLVSILGIVLYYPDFLRGEWLLIIALAVFYLTQNTVALIRFGKLTSFHTYSAKIATIFQGIFLVLFFLAKPVLILFYLAAGFTLISLAEETLMALLLPEWQADVKGLLWMVKRKAAGTKIN